MTKTTEIMEQEKNPTVFSSLTCGIVNELFGKVLKDFIRHVHFTNCIINFHFETLWMSLLNLYQTSNNWLKYKNSDFNISVEATRWAEPKEALCVSSAWNLERRTALWGPIL